MAAEFDQSEHLAPRTSAASVSYSLVDLTIHSPASIISSARELLLEYGHFVAAQSNVASFCFGALKEEVANLPQSYLDQNGGAILALADDRPIGFVAWRSLPAPELASAWELKRLWIRPEARGSGTGRKLVQAVLDRAKANAKSAVLLDTAPHAMAAAYSLYLRLGFVECPPYNGRSPNGILYMRKTV
jgi:GNAT superfamily N-acetyltransferase